MKYILGIDSGGTKYLVRAMNTAGEVLAEYTGVPCRHYQIGEQETAKRVEENITACLSMFGGKREDCLAIAAGISGIDSEEDSVILHRIYRNLDGFDCPIRCLNDAEMTHYTVTGGVGVLVISGTGSIAYGVNEKGESARVGGWLFSIFSDEGSGQYITRKALAHYSRYLVGCYEHTELIALIEERVGKLGRKGLMEFATAIATPPWELPSLSIEVNKAADNGNVYAAEILKDAAVQTSTLADEVIKQLKLYEAESFNIGVWGSAIVKSKLHLAEFSRILTEKYPNAKIALPQTDAADGACRMALSMCK